MNIVTNLNMKDDWPDLGIIIILRDLNLIIG